MSPKSQTNKTKGSNRTNIKLKGASSQASELFDLCQTFKMNSLVLEGLAKIEKPTKIKDLTTMEYLIDTAQQEQKLFKCQNNQTAAKKFAEEAKFLKKLDQLMDKHDLSRDCVAKLSGPVNKLLVMNELKKGVSIPFSSRLLVYSTASKNVCKQPKCKPDDEEIYLTMTGKKLFR